MEVAGTFSLKGNTDLRIDHELNNKDELCIWFVGGLMVGQGDGFNRYLARLQSFEQLANNASATHIHCHLEQLGEVLSRAQHAIYRMLHAMRAQGRPITIYATDEHPEQSEHLKMSQLFVTGLSKRPGAPVKVVDIRRAS